jgi:hypothetical protein
MGYPGGTRGPMSGIRWWISGPRLLAIAAVCSANATAQQPVPLPPPTHELSEEFTRVSSIRELADGRVLILDIRERRLVVADFRTDRVRRIGRSGAGPGEYRQPVQLLAFGGDSTFVVDRPNARWLLLAGDSIAETLTHSTIPQVALLYPPHRGVDNKGHVLYMVPLPNTIPGLGGAIAHTDVIALARTSLTDPRVDTLVRLRGRLLGRKEVRRTIDGQAYEFGNDNPFGVEDQAWLFPDGWIVIVRVDPFRAEWIAPDGTRRMGPELSYDRVRVTEVEKRFAMRYRNGLRDAPPDIFEPDDFPAWPARVTPFVNDALYPLRDGRIAVERRPTAKSTQRLYDIIDRTGNRVMTLALPLRSYVAGFGKGTVYVTRIDEDGLRTVARHPLPGY